MLVQQKVRDYDVWRPLVDAAEAQRSNAGLTDGQVMRAAEDKNQVVILFKAADLVSARAYAESPELREAAPKAGVIDQEMQFLVEH